MSRPHEKVLAFIERHSLLESASGRGPGAGAEQESDQESASPSSSSPIAASKNNPGPRPPAPGPRIHVAHLDHKLRGRESEEDAAFVERLAERLGLPVTIASADVQEEARRQSRG